MSVDVDVSAEGVRVPLSRARVGEIARTTLRAERVPHALLSVTFLSRERIAALNKRHLGHTGPTDVISFGFARRTPRDPVVGDVYIAPQVARANAQARRIPVREELARLVVHGTLHVLGYDHPAGAGREESDMWRRQERLLRRVLRGARR
jgi:probable rRNA maturation factor